MARDGTHSQARPSLGALGSVFALLVAFVAVLTITRRKHQVVPAAALPAAVTLALVTPVEIIEPRTRERRPHRFLTGIAVGISVGVGLGVAGVIAVSVADPEVRSAVVVGAGLRSAPPTTDGEYAARVIAQAMNPTLVYADETGVAALLAQRPVAPPEEKAVMTPIEEDLRDSAAIVFVVLGALTIVSWSGIMWGLSRGAPALRDAVVE